MMNTRPQGALPSNTEQNPKRREQVKAITLRNGRELEEPIEKSNSGVAGKKKNKVTDPQSSKEKGEKNNPHIIKAYTPPISFPQRLKKHSDDKQFVKFLDMFKKLHINIPFANALAQMPKYAKFLKDILVNKRKLEEHETVMLIKECSALITNKLPP